MMYNYSQSMLYDILRFNNKWQLKTNTHLHVTNTPVIYNTTLFKASLLVQKR